MLKESLESLGLDPVVWASRVLYHGGLERAREFEDAQHNAFVHACEKPER